MANISTTPQTENKSAPLASWEPFRMMRDLVGWDPFREMMPSSPQMMGGFFPSFEIKETKEAYLFKADLPGVKQSDLEVTMTGNRLTVSGKRESEKQEQTDSFYASERSYGSFTRSFTLPDGVDTSNVRAELDQGVLTLQIRKSAAAQSKRIAVQSTTPKS